MSTDLLISGRIHFW